MFQSLHINLQKQVIGDSLLEETVFAANAELPLHTHERPSLCMALHGGCTETFGRKLIEFKPFTLGFLALSDEHNLRVHNTELRCFSIELAPALLDRAREYSLKVDESKYVHGGLLIELFTKIYREFRVADAAAALSIEGLMCEVLAEVARSPKLPFERSLPQWLKQAEELLRAEFQNPPQLAVIAAAVNVHSVHLSREFRRHFNCTIGEYVRRLRVDYARRELVASDESLAMIAHGGGYSDQSHFTREFKRLVGVTPRQYRSDLKPR